MNDAAGRSPDVPWSDAQAVRQPGRRWDDAVDGVTVPRRAVEKARLVADDRDDATAFSYAAGDWTAVVSDGFVALLSPDAPAWMVDHLYHRSQTSLVDGMRVLLAHGIDLLPSFVLVVRDAGGTTHIAVRGDVVVSAQIGKNLVSFDGHGAATWVERSLDGVSATVVRVLGAAFGPTRPLVAGVVSACGVHLVFDSADVTPPRGAGCVSPSVVDRRPPSSGARTVARPRGGLGGGFLAGAPSAAPDGQAVIEARGLTKVYRSGSQQIVALDHVDLDIPDGAVTVVLGPSGSGKSTVLNLLGGMDRPTSGTVVCAGSAVHDLSDRELTAYRRDQVGFVFQHYNLIPTLTAAENVGFGSYRGRRRRRTSPTADAPMDPDEALDRLGLGGRGRSFPYELSGGQMQRVAIARALAKRPALLLCDEPTGALDTRTGEEVMEALTDAARSTKAAVVVVTHNRDFEKIADHVIRLRDGSVVDG